MRILFFTDHFRPESSAAASHIYERCKLWSEWGHDVTVLGSAPNFPLGRVYAGYTNSWRFVEELDGIRVVRVKTFMARNEGFFLRVLDYFSYTLSALVFAFFESKPDVVISSSPHLFVAVAGVIYAKIRRVHHVFELRDLWPASIEAVAGMRRGWAYRFLEKLELWLYRHSTRVLAFTEAFRANLLERGVPADKVDVVINGANLELFTPRPKDSEMVTRFQLQDRFVVGYVGTIGLAHGLENVLSAAALLQQEPVCFFLVGHGADLVRLQRRCQELGLTNVIFAGGQPKEAMPRFWSVCDVSLVHLRDHKVFSTVIPSKIFESMAMGLPIVYGGPGGEGAQIVRQHGAGLVVPPEDPAALAAAVRQLRVDPKLCASLKSNSRAAAPLYSRERQAKCSLAVLQRALPGPSEVPVCQPGRQ